MSRTFDTVIKYIETNIVIEFIIVSYSPSSPNTYVLIFYLFIYVNIFTYFVDIIFFKERFIISCCTTETVSL